MRRRDFDELREDFFDRIRATNDAKGHDYAGDEDALANFKEAAEHLIDISDPVFEAWYIYFHKHWSAILTFLKEGDVKSEPIDGRIMDAVLYLILLLGLIEDKKVDAAVAATEARAQLREDELASRAESFRGTEDFAVGHGIPLPNTLESAPPLHVPSAWDILRSHTSALIDQEELAAIRFELDMHRHPGTITYDPINATLIYTDGHDRIEVRVREHTDG